MSKKIVVATVVSCLAVAVSVAWAMPDFSNATLQTPRTNKDLILPAPADASPVISLGQAIDPQSGELVEGFAIIHPKKSAVRSVEKQARAPRCYGFLASGAKWKTVEPWLVNPANTRGLDPAFVYGDLTADIAQWEDAADGVLGNGLSIDILGDGTATSEGLSADTVQPDGKNEVFFANVSDSNAIAVTIVWGIFSGPTFQRRLVEWDQVYDDVDFDWSASGEPAKMDFGNIATHELGHSVGLNDQYNTACANVTMYGYAGTGETNKQTLEQPDIKGVSTLY